MRGTLWNIRITGQRDQGAILASNHPINEKPFDYAAFRSRFAQLKKLTSYERCNLRGDEKKATHNERMAQLVIDHVETHKPTDTYAGVDDNGKETTLRYENWAGDDGEIKPRKIQIAQRPDWWKWFDWDERVDAIPRGHFQPDKLIVPETELSRPTEMMVLAHIAGIDDWETYVVYPGLSISVGLHCL